MIIAKEKQVEILRLATGLNYKGKRLDSAKFAVCEDISSKIYDTASKSAEIHAFLEDAANWPQKPAKVKAERNKQVNEDLPLTAGSLNEAVIDWRVLAGKKFIITSAQNNTDVHLPFLSALKTYAKHLGAQLLISKYTYNKNGFQNGEGEQGLYYAPQLKEFFIEDNVFLNNDSFAFLAQLNTLPTAIYPLTGLAEVFGNYSGAIGHAQITAESIPAMKGQVVRRMYSTGTVTLRNYIQQRSGQKAEALHCYGALIVEFDNDGTFYVRQLQSMDNSGEFYDIDCLVTPSNVVPTTGHVAALQYGDIHAEKLDADCAHASYGTTGGSLLDFLRPKYQLVHDVHDFTSRNHHNRASGHFLAKMFFSDNKGSVKQDLVDTGKVLMDMERDFSQVVIVESNHDLALGRWLDDSKYQPSQDPINARLFYDLNAAVHAAIENKDDTFNLLSYALNNYMDMPTNATFLVTDQSFPIAGIEMGMHGHNGINGSRGQPKQYKKLGIRANTGHTHTASIYGGIYTAGVTGSLDMGYNIGASSWTQTHIITYENGQRTLIDFKNGAFFAIN